MTLPELCLRPRPRIHRHAPQQGGVAAEIIGTPDGSIGKQLYYAKIYLDTDDLLCWTVIIVIISVAFEKLFMLLLRRFYRRLERA